jgi:hypothetical protein
LLPEPVTVDIDNDRATLTIQMTLRKEPRHYEGGEITILHLEGSFKCHAMNGSLALLLGTFIPPPGRHREVDATPKASIFRSS